jgi:hypothetical protein
MSDCAAGKTCGKSVSKDTPVCQAAYEPADRAEARGEEEE